LRDAFGVAASAVILSALDVSCRVKALEAHKKNRRSCLCVGEFPEEIAGWDGLGRAPRVGGILRESERKESDGERENSERENTREAARKHSRNSAKSLTVF
jgi:hypothetical protein